MFHFANIFNSKFQNNYCFVQKLPLSINKKVQSQRFALQELLKQFLLMHHYCTSIFLSHKKVQSRRFALQELLKQFLLMHHCCTSIFLSHKKSAKPALCTPRIAKAILGDAPLLYEQFPIPQKRLWSKPQPFLNHCYSFSKPSGSSVRIASYLSRIIF